jgi:pimeloyl-ACP methyl ester carboxylesterase
VARGSCKRETEDPAGSSRVATHTSSGETADVIPETRFAWNGDVSLAYQVLGDGAMDILYVPGWLSNVDIMWESPEYETFLRRLASFSRLIVMDRRGYGCSERFSPDDVTPLEVHVDDAIAVLDHVGSERAAFFSFDEGTFIGCLLAASHPRRISHLMLLDPCPCWTRNEEITWEVSGALAIKDRGGPSRVGVLRGLAGGGSQRT